MAGSGLITILFTDLVGSTALAQRLGDIAADDLRRAHFDQLRRVLATTGGTEVKTIGDAMMVSYGSGADAISAAVAMQQRVHAGAGGGDSPTLQMRVGISAGEASYEQSDWFGTPIVEASRLCDAADGGQILVADIVRLLGGSRVTHPLVPVGHVEGKGLTAPIRACEVSWAPIAMRSHLDIALPPHIGADEKFDLAGRDDQLQMLRAAWDRATGNERTALFVSGEPGIGKTRLVRELCRHAHDEGAVVLWGSCDEELALPYQPFVEALGWLVDSTPPHVLVELLGPLGGELLPLAPDLDQRVPALAPRLTSDDPETERHRMFEAATELLRNVSAIEPVVLVLDDIHWARKPTLLLLRHLLRSSASTRLLVACTYRDTDLGRTHPLAAMLADLRRESGVDRVALRGLDDAGVAHFVTGATSDGIAELDERGDSLAAAIARETDGNPFFIGEVLRHLRESGMNLSRDRRWRSSTELTDLGVPEGVREVIGRRLSHLDAAANEVLAAASVIGREFDVRTLAAVAGGTERVLDALDSAETGNLIEAVPTQPGAYRFAHALVRSALYDELPTSRRLRLHRDVGLTLERSGRGAKRVTDLARHFTESAALGQVDRAVDYCRRAGDAASDGLAFEVAVAHYERALELLELKEPPDDALQSELLVCAGRVLHQLREPRGRTLLLAAAESGRQRDDVGLMARAFVELKTNVFDDPRLDIDEQQVALGEYVLSRAGELTADLRARVMARLALELVWSDRAERRIELCDQALDLAREVGDRRVLAEVLWSRSVVVDPTRIEVFDTVMAETTETIKAARGIDDSLVCVALTWRMIHHVGRGHVAAGDEDLVEAEELADRLRIPHHVARTKALRAARLLLSGQHEATELMLADYEAYCAREGLVEGVSLANGVRFELMYQRDQAAELESSLVEWLGAQPTAVSARMGLVGIYLQTDRPELARPHIEALGADDFAMIPRNHTFLFYFPALAMSAGLSGVLDVAEAAYHHIARFDDAMPFHGYFEYPIGLSVGVAAGALGWYDRAEQHFARARDLSERAAAPLYVASTQFFWAEVLVNHARPGDAERAREMATAARATAQRLGFAHVQRRAEWLLRRISS